MDSHKDSAKGDISRGTQVTPPKSPEQPSGPARARRPGFRKPGPGLPAIAVLAVLVGAGLYALISDRTCPFTVRSERPGAAAPETAAAAASGPAAKPSAPAVPSDPAQPPSPSPGDDSVGPLPAPIAAPAATTTNETEDPAMASSDQVPPKAAREAVDKLIEEQKFEAAAAECARVRDRARASGDSALWAWALIRGGQLRAALHGYETAVRSFKEEPWPDTPVERDMLDIFYANSLVAYYQAYSWDINRRERVESAGPVDLKSWTRDQILDEAWTALLRVWRDRDRLAGRTAREFPDFWSPGDYPAGVRDTLRDGVVYLLARLLTDSSFWTPRQSNETWLLDLPALLARAGRATSDQADCVIASPASHPVEKIAALLGEHESWSRRARRPAAALEARFELVRALHAAFDEEPDRALVREHLAGHLRSNRRDPWWATGQALLAELTRAEDAADALVRARAIALEAVKRFPSSPGGRRALHIVRSIEAPEFSVEAMRLDAPGRRSVRVTHRNLDRIFLRAYALDAEDLVKSARDYSIFPRGDEARKIAETRRPDAAWTADLAQTSDYRDHATYADLPATLAPGLYLVAASAREDFAGDANKTIGLSVVVGDLVLVTRPGGGPVRGARAA
ncbi:MAG TPA: hypothetical protein ENO03_00855, partial [Candidatus Aminicenantes bacterium]|nr:hypothetical protein [Candidatus Aminicenantes bacterium]